MPTVRPLIVAVAATTTLLGCRGGDAGGDDRKDFPVRVELARSRAELLAHRHNKLEGHAYGVCPLGAVGPGLAVVFRYRADTARSTGRAVTMTAHFDSLRVQHRDFILANVADSGAACRRVSPRGSLDVR